MRRFQIFFLILIALSGCSKPIEPGSKLTKEPPASSNEGSKRDATQPTLTSLAPVSNRPSNHKGEVLIVEYHKIAKQEARWDRSETRFRGDLERFYSMGFRPITLREYVEDKFKIGPGALPLVVTFDDANPTQFKLLPDGKVDPACAVGIWQEFASKHPDFPVKATFLVLPDVMWGQSKLVDKKIAMLKALGCEIGSHTMTHPKLSHLTDEQVKGELGGAIDFLASKGVQQPVSLALPYGISPKNTSLLKSFEWKGKQYQMSAAVLVGSNPAPAPGTPHQNLYRIPRIQGIEGDQGITFWLDKVQKGAIKPYVE